MSEKPKSPESETASEKTEFERFIDLTERIVSVPKSSLPEASTKHLKKRKG